ncbi:MULTISPECIES: hypothetical protein [unclassified Adlercreutzia]|uniref:hypothetical protein n=1 Tax=unclassified Adlercreutzia TaxID=2636013 RepID=UPI0013EA2921|nr:MULTISPECIES: hypothetical protein [unclassified Adlercreutzia]
MTQTDESRMRESELKSEPEINWDDPAMIRPDEKTGITILPAELYFPEDDGLYDDLIK